jgi:hypothetical protein
MKKSVNLYSPLSPTQIATRLKAIMEDDMPDAKARVYGSGTQYDMQLRYVQRNFRDSSAPSLTAEMEPWGSGTLITGDVGRSPMARLFPFIWFGFLSIFVLAGIVIMAFLPDGLIFGLMFTGVPVLMMVIGGLVFRLAPDTDGDGDEIMAFLQRELNVRTLPQDQRSRTA